MDRASVWHSCAAVARQLMHSALCTELESKKLAYGQSSSYAGSCIFNGACVALTCCNAVRQTSVYVPPELLLICASGCKWLARGTPNTPWPLWETAPFSSGLPPNPARRFLGFTPQCEIINSRTPLERLLKKYTSIGVCIYTGLLKLPCGKKRGQNEKEQTRCSASYKVRP